MFIRPQPYTCLRIEWLTQGGVVKQASKQAWLGSGLLFFMFISGPNPTPVWELNVQSKLFTWYIEIPSRLGRCDWRSERHETNRMLQFIPILSRLGSARDRYTVHKLHPYMKGNM